MSVVAGTSFLCFLCLRCICYYSVIRSVRRDNKFTVDFHFMCRVMDFSAGVLLIGMKFCVMVRSDLRQVFSPFWGGIAEGWPSFERQQGPYGGICFLLKHMLCFFVFGCLYQCNQFSGKTHVQNDLLCVKWDVKPY